MPRKNRGKTAQSRRRASRRRKRLLHPSAATQRSRQNANSKVIFLLATVCGFLLIASAVYSAVVDKPLLTEIVRYVERYLLAILVMAGLRGARNGIGL